MDNGDTDGSANWNKKSVIAQKEPKSKAKLLVEKEPRSKIPDSEIHPENIMISSPIYIPYKKILKSSQGCGQFGKKIKFPTSSSLEMPQQKWTLTKKEWRQPNGPRSWHLPNFEKPKMVERTLVRHYPPRWLIKQINLMVNLLVSNNHIDTSLVQWHYEKFDDSRSQ